MISNPPQKSTTYYSKHQECYSNFAQPLPATTVTENTIRPPPPNNYYWREIMSLSYYGGYTTTAND